MRRFLLVGLGVAAALYGLLVAVVYFDQRSMQYFPVAEERAPAVEGVAIQVVRLTTSDGERLVAWYHRADAGKPTILFLDGNANHLSIQTGRWRRIAEEGVGFLAVAYRGYSGSTGHPTEKGLIIDAETGYAWLAARVPAKDIVIHGFSLGSGPAVRLAVGHPARALVLEAPYAAAVDVGARRMPLLPVRWLMKDRWESKRWIRHVHMPLLIVHGDRDTVIPYGQGRELFALANAPKVFVRMPGSDHNTLVRDGLYLHVWRFLGLEPSPA